MEEGSAEPIRRSEWRVRPAGSPVWCRCVSMATRPDNWKFRLIAAMSAAIIVAFGTAQSGVFSEDDPSSGSHGEGAESSGPPPYIPPPSPGAEHWSMPDLWIDEPPFPYLPGEDRSKSRSVGGVVHGHLVNSVAIPQPHPGLAFLDVHYERGLFYTTDRMREIVEGAAAHVREHFPDAVVPLGNFGNPGGGDIPYSFSHNSGRDADIGFFLKGPDGDPAVPSELVGLDRRGRYNGEEGEFRFDVARNWRLVEGLIEAGGDQLQYIFISRPLKRMLMREASRVGASREIRRRARAVLHQPHGSLPHNDHFHVRIYCSAIDVASGCWDRGTKHSWYDPFEQRKRAAIRDGREALEREEPDVRARAARRLALLEDTGSESLLVESLEVDAPQVRAAAARALAALDTGRRAVGERLPEESDAQAYLEMVDAMSRLGGPYATRVLTEQLDAPRSITLPGRMQADSRAFVADALIRLEEERPVDALVELLESDSADVRRAAARALNHLTNRKFGDEWGASDPERRRADLERWRRWLRENGDKSRERWLIEGFDEAGYDVERLDSAHVWPLCRAVTDEDHLSYNAQRVLMGISGRQPESLSWSKKDASVFWRRWFERRRQRFGVAPVPDGMSTLN